MSALRQSSATSNIRALERPVPLDYDRCFAIYNQGQRSEGTPVLSPQIKMHSQTFKDIEELSPLLGMQQRYNFQFNF